MKKRVFALFTAMFLLCGMLAGCGPTGSSSTTTDGSDDGAKDTLIVAIPESPTYMDPMVQASIGTYRVTTQMFDLAGYEMTLDDLRERMQQAERTSEEQTAQLAGIGL